MGVSVLSKGRTRDFGGDAGHFVKHPAPTCLAGLIDIGARSDGSTRDYQKMKCSLNSVYVPSRFLDNTDCYLQRTIIAMMKRDGSISGNARKHHQ
jgi:hypothetical protein